LRIAITGSTGLIGSALVRSLVADGHDVRRLVRRATRASDEVSWNPDRNEIDAKALAGVDAVVNLAGEAIAQRWTRDSTRAIRDSRVNATSLIARTMATLSPRPSALVSGSAVGYYGERGSELLDETSSAGDAGIRVAISRTGIVLDPRGGALAKMLLPFRFGVGGRLGDGSHWMSWIALADMVRALRFLVDAEKARGAFDLTAPNPVDNAEFTRVLASVLHRPAIFPVPTLALELLYGQMAKGAALASQRVLPRKLLQAGFEFSLPNLETALASILRAAAD
jgi:uncharacterized protein